ncbi:glycosyltransferase [Pseudonocardia alaniniphila]|uniref:Glycosyltransferase n=1 Tax=Pseudonocardia alaniniphila TaxID=75291 RepID=A0ABS9TL41_9PSEU|nr:glycosyltransferase [Pseudonocardia alaniniphila]MCH6169261.1 glycosyltransferase [Pseudonocardia alaniniphila]
MRVLLTSLPVYSHLVPMVVPVAQALRAAGHEVAVATGAAMAPHLERAGLPHLVLPRMRTMEELRRISLRPDGTPAPEAATLGPGEAVGRIFAGATAVRAASDMLEMAPAFGPDLVVRECGEFGGHLLAETLGLPCATLDIGPLGPVADPGLLPSLNEARDVVGLPPLDDVSVLTREPWFSWMPESWYPDASHGAPRCYRAPASQTDEALDPAIVSLSSDRPFVLAGLGSVSSATLAPEASPLPRIVDALATLPCTAVVALGSGVDPSEWSGSRPPNVHLTSFVQQSLLLPACDLFLSHVGANSVREALASGVPIVAMPLFAEQPLNAQRLTDLGLGVIADKNSDATTVAAACRKVLEDPAFRRSARGFQRTILGLPGIGRMVADLAAMVA